MNAASRERRNSSVARAVPSRHQSTRRGPLNQIVALNMADAFDPHIEGLGGPLTAAIRDRTNMLALRLTSFAALRRSVRSPRSNLIWPSGSRQDRDQDLRAALGKYPRRLVAHRVHNSDPSIAKSIVSLIATGTRASVAGTEAVPNHAHRHGHLAGLCGEVARTAIWFAELVTRLASEKIVRSLSTVSKLSLIPREVPLMSSTTFATASTRRFKYARAWGSSRSSRARADRRSSTSMRPVRSTTNGLTSSRFARTRSDITNLRLRSSGPESSHHRFAEAPAAGRSRPVRALVAEAEPSACIGHLGPLSSLG